VIGANGKLTGYAGGIERKLWLLQHEGLLIHAAQNKQQLEATIRQRQTKTQFLK
jgi:methylated-DNA-[protein]-cysteine S-methyltransferase